MQQSQEAKYESCLREAETKHVFPLASLDEMDACNEEAGLN